MESSVTTSISPSSSDSNSHGCNHYRRHCKVSAPCCNIFYSCHNCHDEMYTGPKTSLCLVDRMERKTINRVQCLFCSEIQPPSSSCKNCGKSFGKYFCPACNLYEDNSKKKIFHCDECGICRIGLKEEFFHCSTCNVCLGIMLKDNHKCYQNALQQNCAICLENLFFSRETTTLLPNCNHWMHLKCFNAYIKTNIACPICCKSLYKMQEEEIKHIDNLIQESKENLPEELKSKKVEILCNDCLKTSKEVDFHFIGFKCKFCGSYNTKM